MDGEQWGAAMDIILKGHRSEMEVVVVGMGREVQGGGGGVSERASEGEMSWKPRLRCHVRCGGSARGVHQQLDSIRWWWMEGRQKARRG